MDFEARSLSRASAVGCSLTIVHFLAYISAEVYIRKDLQGDIAFSTNFRRDVMIYLVSDRRTRIAIRGCTGLRVSMESIMFSVTCQRIVVRLSIVFLVENRERRK